MRTAGSVLQPAVRSLSAPKGYRRYHACLAVSATVATAAVEATSTAESITVETAAMKAAITMEAAITAEAAMKAAIKATATVEAATKETITVPEAKATAPETKPGAGAEEDAAVEPFRAVIAVGSAGVGIIIVIAIGADGSWAVIDRPSKSNAEGDALGVRV